MGSVLNKITLKLSIGYFLLFFFNKKLVYWTILQKTKSQWVLNLKKIIQNLVLISTNIFTYYL